MDRVVGGGLPKEVIFKQRLESRRGVCQAEWEKGHCGQRAQQGQRPWGGKKLIKAQELREGWCSQRTTRPTGRGLQELIFDPQGSS